MTFENSKKHYLEHLQAGRILEAKKLEEIYPELKKINTKEISVEKPEKKKAKKRLKLF